MAKKPKAKKYPQTIEVLMEEDRMFVLNDQSELITGDVVATYQLVKKEKVTRTVVEERVEVK